MEERDYSKLTIWQRRLMVAGFGVVGLLIMLAAAPSKARLGQFSWGGFRFGALLGVVPAIALLAWLTSPSAQHRMAGLSQSRGAALGGAIGFPIMWALVYAPPGRAVVLIYGVVAGFCLGIALWGLFGRFPPLSPPGPPGSDAPKEAAPGVPPMLGLGRTVGSTEVSMEFDYEGLPEEEGDLHTPPTESNPS